MLIIGASIGAIPPGVAALTDSGPRGFTQYGTLRALCEDESELQYHFIPATYTVDGISPARVLVRIHHGERVVEGRSDLSPTQLIGQKSCNSRGLCSPDGLISVRRAFGGLSS
jgi:hypothetical protein